MAGSWRHILESATGNPLEIGGPCVPLRGSTVRPVRGSTRPHNIIRPFRLAACSNASWKHFRAGWRKRAGILQLPPGRWRMQGRLLLLACRQYRPAPPSGQPAAYSPAPPPVQQPGYRPAPSPVQPSGYRLPGAGREPPAAQERAPLSQEEVPYQSLMDALSRATPTMLTEAEKNAPAERLPAIRKTQAASRRKLGWRSTVAISALVLTAGLSAYALLGHGGLSRLGKIAGMNQTGQTPSAILSNGAWVNVPLPKRRPAALRAEQGPGHGEPASAAN